MELSNNLSYEESLYFIGNVKKDYKDILLSFSVFGGNEEVIQKIRVIKNNIYSLLFDEWKKDKLWEFINDDIEYTELWKFV